MIAVQVLGVLVLISWLLVSWFGQLCIPGGREGGGRRGGREEEEGREGGRRREGREEEGGEGGVRE